MLYLSRKNRGLSCTKDSQAFFQCADLVLHVYLFQFHYHLKYVTVGNEVRLGKSWWNDFVKKIKIGRDHLSVFRTILLFLETFTLSVCTKEFPYRNNENGNTRSIVFAERVYKFNGIYSKKSTQYVKVGERTSGWTKKKKKIGWPTESIS